MRRQVYRSVRDLFVSGSGQLYLLALAAVCLAIEGFYVATVPPVSGYETSIYEAYPLPFWTAFFLGLSLVIVILLTSSVSSRGFYGRALTLLVANYGILLFLPTFRGYQLHDNVNGDLLAHLSFIRTIATSGNVPDLWYPFEHILMGVFTMFGVPLEESSILFTLVFFVLFVTTTGIFVRSLLQRKFGLAAGTAAASPLLMASLTVGALPSIFSILLLPLLMTFAHRFRRTFGRRYLGLLCLTAVVVIVFHPVTSLFLLVLLFSTWLFGQGYDRLTGYRIPTPDLNVALAIIPILFLWYARFDKTWFMANEQIQTLTGTFPSPVEATAQEALLLTLPQTVIRFIQLYGAVFIYLAIAGVVTAIVAYQVYRNDITYSGSYLSFQFVVGFVFALVFLLTPIESFTPIRSLRFMIIMAVLLVSLTLVWAARSEYHRSITAVLAGAIIVATVISGAGVYQPNIQMTKSEFEGVDYVTEYQDPAVDVYSLRMSTKVEDYVHSVPRSEIDTYHFRDGNEIPPRLGYAENETAAKTFGEAVIVTKEADTEFYTASYYFPRQQEFLSVYNESDESLLLTDRTVDKVYDNGGFSGWRVEPEE